ncbi:hypothetical protein ZIOFF_041538 [Zingiber officinale]|uniref:Remorin C-terminal domain-containing protein n=1 Tax=Zingiber officinale TaxID=94328 RepID=A0A8J5L5Z6_ZINOF|nr:hypothetical protein ZIOFF_041538 [Zingiber officinale]
MHRKNKAQGVQLKEVRTLCCSSYSTILATEKIYEQIQYCFFFSDAVLSRLATEKKLSLIKAWEDNEKTKTENKAVKKLSTIAGWENSREAAVEAEFKRKEVCYSFPVVASYQMMLNLSKLHVQDELEKQRQNSHRR